jgi:hypothetical protein
MQYKKTTQVWRSVICVVCRLHWYSDSTEYVSECSYNIRNRELNKQMVWRSGARDGLPSAFPRAPGSRAVDEASMLACYWDAVSSRSVTSVTAKARMVKMLSFWGCASLIAS